MLLKEIVRQNRAAFFPGSSDWKDAIRKSCQPLVDTGCATPAYAQRIIECVEEFGPYIVIVPGLAIPHSTKGSPGVSQTAISFVRFEQPVIFDPEDREKDARVFFALAAVDEDAHIKICASSSRSSPMRNCSKNWRMSAPHRSWRCSMINILAVDRHSKEGKRVSRSGNRLIRKAASGTCPKP